MCVPDVVPGNGHLGIFCWLTLVQLCALCVLCALCALCALLLVDPCTVVYPGSTDLATLNILAIGNSEQIILDQNDLKLKKIVLVTGQKKVKKDIDRAGRSLITIESREGHPRLLMTSSFAVHSPPHHHHCLLFISFTLQLTQFLSCRCHQTFCLAYLKTFLWKQFRLKSGGHKKSE